MFDTLLDETTILGIAQGAAHIGFLPIPEIQYLAYLHNAIDQLRGRSVLAAVLPAASTAIPWWCACRDSAYQKGFGGHFHNDNSQGAARHSRIDAVRASAR
ncbi:MAG: hypothetical protein U1E76_18240 [Planctomycetota bacterium]